MMYKAAIGVKIKILIHYTGDKNIHVKVGLNKELGRMANLGKVFEGTRSLHSCSILVSFYAYYYSVNNIHEKIT